MARFGFLFSQPSSLYLRDRYFYFKYDGFYFLLFGGLAMWMLLGGIQPLVRWQSWYMVFFPVALYVHILCNVFVHNCCHSSFPRSINRMVGELCGVIVAVRFGSWEILHRRHHRFSDDPERDPHHVHPNFWLFLWRSIGGMEVQLQKQAYDQFGDTPRNRRLEQARSVFSFLTAIPLLGLWYLVLGPQAFWFIFVPVQILGWLHVMHFNWVTHDAYNPDGDYKPINIDRGVYWLGNRILFGLYMHGNHHRWPQLFNPMFVDARLKERDSLATSSAGS